MFKTYWLFSEFLHALAAIVKQYHATNTVFICFSMIYPMLKWIVVQFLCTFSLQGSLSNLKYTLRMQQVAIF